MNTRNEKETVPRISIGTDRESHEYELTNWRKAFNRYLDAVWSQLDQDATGTLRIGGVCISLHQGDYSIQCPADEEERPRPNLHRDQIHAVTSERKSLELGLAKFVRNNHIRMLVIEWPALRLMFFKGSWRTDLYFTVVDRTF